MTGLPAAAIGPICCSAVSSQRRRWTSACRRTVKKQARQRFLRRMKQSFGHGRLDTRVDLNDTGRQFLEASIRADRVRRWRAAAGVISLVVLLVLTTSFALWRSREATRAKDQAVDSAQQAIASRLYNEAADILAGTSPGGDVQAFQKLIAAHTLAEDVDAGGLLDAAMQRLTTFKIADAGDVVVRCRV